MPFSVGEGLRLDADPTTLQHGLVDTTRTLVRATGGFDFRATPGVAASAQTG